MRERKNELSILFGGDFCPRLRTEKIILDGVVKQVFGNSLPVFHDKDLSVINLEAPLTRANSPIKKSGPNIKLDPKCIDALKYADLDIAILANNHICDYGERGVYETLDILKDNGIMSVGAGKNMFDAAKPLILEEKGRKIAFLAFAETEFNIPGKDSPGANMLDPLKNIKQIQNVSSETDITIVLVHGGNEYNPIPSPRMRQTYRAFADAGASAVVCGHTHCPQGIEKWNGVPIIYSMGNLLMDARKKMEPDSLWWTGYMVKIGFAEKRISNLDIIPYSFGPDAGEIRLLEGHDLA